MTTSSRRFATTAENTEKHDKEDSSAPVDHKEGKPHPPLPPDDDEEHSGADPTFRQKLRARYDAKRDEYRHRAEEARDSARTHYAEFREHPAERARDGARSFGGMVQRYGPVFVGTYAGVYFGTLGLLFAGVEGGALDPVALFQWLGQENGGGADSTVQLVVDFMEGHSLTRPYAHVIERNPSAANLAVAWIAVKFTEPVRLALSFALTPRVARYFGYNQGAADQEAEKKDTSGGADGSTSSQVQEKTNTEKPTAAATEKSESETGSKR